MLNITASMQYLLETYKDRKKQLCELFKNGEMEPPDAELYAKIQRALEL